MVPIPIERISALSNALTDVMLELRESDPPEATDGELLVVLTILQMTLIDRFAEPTIRAVVKILIETVTEDERSDCIADLLTLCAGAQRKRVH